jgi:hypothetical protein
MLRQEREDINEEALVPDAGHDRVLMPHDASNFVDNVKQ